MSQSRLETIVSKSTIQQYSQGVAADSQSPVGGFLAPTVEVSKPQAYFKVYDDKNRFRIPDTLRAISGRATELGWEKTDSTYNCAPHALDVPVDIIETDDDETMESSLQEAADLAGEVSSLAHEKQVLDLAIKTLTPDAKAFSFADNVDVVDKFDEALVETLVAARYGSRMGLGVVFGPTFLRKLKNHPQVRGRFLGGGKKEVVNPSVEDLVSLFLVKTDVQLSFMYLDQAPAGKNPDVKLMLDDSCIIFARHAAPTRRDPSFMKTFRLRNKWMAPRVYERDDKRVQYAALDWSCDVKVTNASAGCLLKI